MRNVGLLNTASSASGLQISLAADERVLVLGGYGLRNMGDEAILAGLLTQIAPLHRVTVVSHNPAETTAIHGVRAISPAQAPLALPRTDLLIIGGGGLFSGHMGKLGRLIPAFGLLASTLGVRVALTGIGVYPTTPPWLLLMLLHLARRKGTASVTVRDSLSQRTLAAKGVKARLVPDLSWLLPQPPARRGEEILTDLGLDHNRPIVGLALTAVNHRFDGFLEGEVPCLIDALPEVQFCFAPTSQHPRETRHNDLRLARRLQAVAPATVIAEGILHPQEALALFSQFSTVVGMRYHSLLFAERMGVPVLPVAYAEKCEDWLQEHEVEPTEPTAEALLVRLHALLSKGITGISHAFSS